jgi:hypothetical protein
MRSRADLGERKDRHLAADRPSSTANVLGYLIGESRRIDLVRPAQALQLIPE